MASVGLFIFFAIAYFVEFDRCAGMTRQYLDDAEQDIEMLNRLGGMIAVENTNALLLIKDQIAVHQKRIDVGLSGEGFRNK